MEQNMYCNKKTGHRNRFLFK